MATGYTKTLVASAVDIGGKDDVSRMTQRYHVSASTPITLEAGPFVSYMQSQGELPYPGDAFTTFAYTSLEATMRLRSIQAADIPKGAGKYEVTLVWATRYSWEKEGSSAINAAVLRWRKAASARTRPLPCWRKLTDATAPPAGGSDMGGTKIDSGGRPKLLQVPQVELLYTFTIDSSVVNLVALDDDMKTYVGSINSSTFLGSAADTVLCTGIEFEQIEDEYWALRIRALYDRLKHYEQVPDSDASGAYSVNSSGQCSSVKWVRDYPTADLNNLIDSSSAGAATVAYHKHRAEKGEYVWTA